MFFECRVKLGFRYIPVKQLSLLLTGIILMSNCESRQNVPNKVIKSVTKFVIYVGVL